MGVVLTGLYLLALVHRALLSTARAYNIHYFRVEALSATLPSHSTRFLNLHLSRVEHDV